MNQENILKHRHIIEIKNNKRRYIDIEVSFDIIRDKNKIERVKSQMFVEEKTETIEEDDGYISDVTTETVKVPFGGFHHESWHCIICDVDMGANNPRQYCGKICCDKYQR